MRVAAWAGGRFTGAERAAAWLVVLALGGLQAFTFADRLDPDGIAYLDLAAAYARGDWGEAVNAYWSPALSWILALLMRPLDLVGCAGLARVHVLLVGFQAFSLWSYERLVIALGEAAAGPDAGRRGWRWFTYGAFALVTMQMIGLVWLTPDMLLVGVVCLVAAAGLRMLAPDSTHRNAVVFGLLLGVAYWIKSPLFPLAFVFLGTAWGLMPGRRRRVTPAAVSFALAAAAWAVPLSIHEGRPTFGDAGRLNAAWFLGTAPVYTHWEGAEGTGSPQHPLRRLEDAGAFAFDGAFPQATYPPWYSPEYWHEGVRVDIRPAAAARNARQALQLLARSTPAPFLLASLAMMWLLALVGPGRIAVRRETLLLVVPGIVGLTAYILLHVELRLAAPLWLLAWIGLLAMPGLSLEAARRWFAPLAFALAVAMTAPPLRDAARQVGWLRAGETPGRDRDCSTAAELGAAGLDRGARIAVVGDASAAAWAWMGGFRIVADVPRPATYWSLTPAERDRLDGFFARAGARAVVAPEPGRRAAVDEWRRLTPGLLFRPLKSLEP